MRTPWPCRREFARALTRAVVATDVDAWDSLPTMGKSYPIGGGEPNPFVDFWLGSPREPAHTLLSLKNCGSGDQGLVLKVRANQLKLQSSWQIAKNFRPAAAVLDVKSLRLFCSTFDGLMLVESEGAWPKGRRGRSRTCAPRRET